MKIKFTFVMLLVTLLLIGSSNALAAKKFKFNASDTFVFDPFNVGGGFAQWLDGIGEGDSPNCRTNFGLLLQKTPSTETVLSVGTELEGLSGAVVTDDDTLGYDIRNDSPCLAGSPRFNVTYTLPDGTEGFSFVGGCANGTITTSPQNPNWSRVTFDLQTQAFPAIPVGSVIESVILIVDDQGSYTVDNIQFRDWFFDKPGSNPGNDPRCSF
jgi:hypothetical protein